MDIKDLELGRFDRLFRSAGIGTVEELTKRNARELLAIAGVGRGAVDAVVRSLKMLGLALADDEWSAYTCVRDARTSWDTALTSFHLCDNCTAAFVGNAFDSRAPEYEGPSIDGFCEHCNLRREVRLRQWFLCGVCARVVRSIGRGVVAARYFAEFWADKVQPVLPHLGLVETDPPELRRRAPSATTPNISFDFQAQTSRRRVEFGFELKTGRSHLGKGGVGSGMSSFQLDTTDCDDFTAAAIDADAPGYLVHIQVLDRAEPPTTRYAAVGLWWIDMFSMADAFEKVTQRPRENRPAAYFRTKSFRSPGELAEHLRGPESKAVRSRFSKDGPPVLYR